MNQEKINSLIAEGFLMSNKHPTQDLWIYNYTAKCQYDRVWNEMTLASRGLILDKNYQVVARPFPKFFNLEEHRTEEIPNETFEVFEKMDGSLGILYWIDNQPFIATRGSFNSEQCLKATEYLYGKYKASIPLLSKEKTYLFEIIYPENKIVVDYAGEESLTLLAIIETASGKDLPLEELGFPIVKRFDGVYDFEVLKKRNLANSEGYVLKFQNGFRVKVKFEEYVRLHRLMTSCSTITIWETLKENKSWDEQLDQVPDEFYNWVKKIKNELENEYKKIENEAKSVFKVFDTKKETALYFMTQKYPSVLFGMLDGKDYSQTIWKMIRPKFSKPFRDEM
jgi:T4 RnlA family RNA ligase